MLPKLLNLFENRPANRPGEQVIPLLQASQWRLEHIISHGQPTDAGCWYDQPDPEWVLLVRGVATLRFAAGDSLEFKAGDCLLIPARLKHRVESCSPDAVWVALHYREPGTATADPAAGLQQHHRV